jgi:hypothetical protein
MNDPISAVSARLVADRIRILADCAEYLKPGETPAQCIQRNRDDVSLALAELARCKAELQEWRKTAIWLGVGLLVSAVLFLVEHWP